MDFLNKIGQRNVANLLIVVSMITSLVIFGLKLKGIGISQTPTIIAIVLGTIIFSLSNIILCIAAHKSRDHRVMAIFTSGIIVLLNGILFALSLNSPKLSDFLLVVSLIEIIFAIIFLIVVARSEAASNKSENMKINTQSRKEELVK